MRPTMPSPAMVVALVALVVALSGTAIAAVDFARNAGAVDGKSAVTAQAPLKLAAGKLVATAAAGPRKGRLPGRYVSDVMRGGSTSITRDLLVVDDDAGGGPVVPLAIIPKIGRLDAQCRDQDPAPGVESTQTVVSFTAAPSAGRAGVNVSRLLGRDIQASRDGIVFTAPPSMPVPIMQFAESVFQLVLQARDRTVFISGGARPEGNLTPDAKCLIFGIALRVG